MIDSILIAGLEFRNVPFMGKYIKLLWIKRL